MRSKRQWQKHEIEERNDFENSKLRMSPWFHSIWGLDKIEFVGGVDIVASYAFVTKGN